MSKIPIANMPKGIDVSKFQRRVNWAEVKASGRSFAFARVIDDKTGTTADPFFARNFQGMKDAGLLRGVYHIFNPRRNARDAANLFLSLVGSLGPGDLQPVIDVELDGSQRNRQGQIIVRPLPDDVLRRVTLDGVAEWIDIVEAKLGRQVIIYTFTPFWVNQLGDSRRFSNHPLWIANFNRNQIPPPIPSAFPFFSFHQHTNKGSVPGVNGDVDLDRFNGTMNGLRAFANLPPIEEIGPAPVLESITVAAFKSAIKARLSKRRAAKPGKTTAKKKTAKKGTRKAARQGGAKSGTKKSAAKRKRSSKGRVRRSAKKAQ